MLRRTVEIATPGTRLSVALGQLVIARPDQPDARVPLAELGALVIDDGRASLSQAVLREAAAAGAVVIVSGADHLPAGLMLPMAGHHALTERQRAQAAAGLPLKKRLWQAIVIAKIAQQGRLLAAATGSDSGLAAMARRVRSGDPDNLEAQAAQRYWPRLLGAGFHRERGGDGANALLNYGYAVLRAACARAIVASGLVPTLGLWHRHRANPFCLADDLMEPFRPLVDQRVVALLADSPATTLEDRPTRAALLALLNEGVRLGGRRWPLLLGLEQASAGLAQALSGGDWRAMPVPDSLALAPEADDGAA
ncbi:hypothetical protein IP88_01360 [alpha proteobacterium AAP81b]|nr:hypothetical protein IP88_01360 [alpha proteobacterium AAP81b]